MFRIILKASDITTQSQNTSVNTEKAAYKFHGVSFLDWLDLTSFT